MSVGGGPFVNDKGSLVVAKRTATTKHAEAHSLYL